LETVNHKEVSAMEDDAGTGLPASVETAWGLRERPSKGPRPGLSLGRIVEAAIKVADADGLAAVSMHRVAGELGAAAMSLYRYVKTKDELVELMADASLGPAPAAAAPDEGWRAGLSRWAWTELAGMRRHPWVLRVPVTKPPTTPNQVAWLEQGLRSLRDTGLSETEKLSAILLLTSYVRSYATLTAEIGAAGQGSQEAMSAYGRLLARLTDPEHFPALHAVIAAGVFDAADEPDAEFVFGLERVFDGIEALVRKRNRGPARPRRRAPGGP
jgi:AcrR family transcriptional regulator